MAEPDETIITRLVLEADDALAKNQEYRETVDEIKAALRSMAAESKESLDVVKASFKDLTLEDFRQEIAATKEEIAELRALLALPEEIAPQLAKLAELQEKQKHVMTSLSIAAKELRKEFDLATEAAKRGFKDASTESENFRTRVNKAKDELKGLIEEGKRLSDAIEGLKRTNRFTFSEMNVAVREYKEELKGAKGGVSDLEEEVSGLGTVSQFVFGSVLGISAIAVLRSLINLLNEATQAAFEFTQEQFRMEVAIRGLQRLGLDTTLKEWRDFIKEIREEFPIFTVADVQESIGAVAHLERQFGFTSEQLKELIRDSVVLSIMMGKTLPQAADILAIAVATRWFITLKRIGVNITDTTLALEAIRQGLVETEAGWRKLDEATKTAVALTVVTENLAAIQEDAARITEFAAGKQRTLNAAWGEFKRILGELVVPAIAAVGVGITKLIDNQIIPFINITKMAAIEILAAWGALVVGIRLAALSITSDTITMQDAIDGAREALAQLTLEFAMQFFPEDFSRLGDEIIGVGEDIEETLEGIPEDVQNLILALRRMSIQLVANLEQLAENNNRKLDDIMAKFNQRVEDQVRRLQEAIAKVNRQAIDRRADAERRFRDREEEAERDFQERMRRLREDFLFDLEDALRERDARQILRLIRQFNLQKDRMKREREEGKKERKDRFNDELRDIEEQRKRRLRELGIEHQQRLAEIELQAQREREAAELAFRRRIEDEKARFRERMQLLELQHKDELGLIQKFYEAQLSLFAQFLQARNAMIQGLTAPQPQGGGGGKPPTPFQEGGTLVATKPTLVMFGETPEVVSFRPLTRPGANVGKVFGGALPTGMNGGKVRIDLLLSPDLEARVVDKAIGDIAEVFVQRMR